MIDNLSVNKKLWLILALCTCIAAVTGVTHPDIYDGLLREDMLAGTMAQDFVSIVASVIIVFYTIRMREEAVFQQIVLLSMVAYLFYAYGIYVIERVYNPFYLLYMAIFGLSFYTLLYALGHMRKQVMAQYHYTKGIRNLSVGFLLFIPVMFNLLWIMSLLPLMQTGQRIDYFYSVYILDLCFIMPAFVIIAFKMLKNEPLGTMLSPMMFIFSFTLLLPVGLGELLKPHYHLTADLGGMLLYLSLSTLFIFIALLELRHLKRNCNKNIVIQ